MTVIANAKIRRRKHVRSACRLIPKLAQEGAAEVAEATV
jgi:hypothetical protein